MQCSGTNLACTISVPYSSRHHKSTSRLQWHSARDVATYGQILVIILSILGQYINFSLALVLLNKESTCVGHPYFKSKLFKWRTYWGFRDPKISFPFDDPKEVDHWFYI